MEAQSTLGKVTTVTLALSTGAKSGPRDPDPRAPALSPRPPTSTHDSRAQCAPGSSAQRIGDILEMERGDCGAQGTDFTSGLCVEEMPCPIFLSGL